MAVIATWWTNIVGVMAETDLRLPEEKETGPGGMSMESLVSGCFKMIPLGPVLCHFGLTFFLRTSSWCVQFWPGHWLEISPVTSDKCRHNRKNLMHRGSR